jgi:hypothetical protein
MYSTHYHPSGDSKFPATIPLKSGAPPALARANSEGSSKNPRREFLYCFASRITQPRPRKILRLCILFSIISCLICTISMGCLLYFLLPHWWMCIIPWAMSTVPLLFSFMSGRTGRWIHIAYLSASHFAAVCCAIVITCMIMTLVETAVALTTSCFGKPTLAVSCEEFTDFQYNLSKNRAVLTALVVIYGTCCIVLSGVSMMYAFFLYRRAKTQPQNWLTSPLKPSPRLKIQQRSISASTV